MTIEKLRQVLTSEALRLFDAVRARIREMDPDVVEVGWPVQKTAGFGVGPKKMSEQYIYITAHKSHINLGFYYGAELPDPHGLLPDSGNKTSMRSVKITDPAQLDAEGLTELMRAAMAQLPRRK